MWMDLEGIMLSEISQREKDKYPMLSLNMQNLKKLNLKKWRVEWYLSKAEVGGRGCEMLVRVYTFSYKMYKFWGSKVQHGGYNYQGILCIM